MDHKKLKNIGWKLILSKAFRKFYQDMEDFQEKRIADLRADVEESQKKELEYLKRLQQQLEQSEAREEYLKQRFTEILEQFDVLKIMPYLHYLKGLQYTPDQHVEAFPTAIIRAHINKYAPYPDEHINGIRNQIKENMKLLNNCLADHNIVQQYFYHDEDRVIVRIDNEKIIAGVFSDQDSYESAKRKKSREMDKLIDEISR